MKPITSLVTEININLNNSSLSSIHIIIVLHYHSFVERAVVEVVVPFSGIFCRLRGAVTAVNKSHSVFFLLGFLLRGSVAKLDA